MTATTISQSLALLQFLEYTAYGDYAQHQQLMKDVESSIHERIVEGAFDSDKFLYASLLVWRLRSSRLCLCGKAIPDEKGSTSLSVPSTGRRCDDCHISVALAQKFMSVAQRKYSSIRVSAVLTCLQQAYQRLQLPTADQHSTSKLRDFTAKFQPNLAANIYDPWYYMGNSHSSYIRNSWIGRYLLASQIYERDGLCAFIDIEEGSVLTKESHLSDATQIFRSLIGYHSDEHRRSLWHLTTVWYQKDVVPGH